MFILLYLLIKISDIINVEKYSIANSVLIRLPFSIYFGWITIATIANVTVFLQSINWNGFGLSEQLWTIIVLLVGATIGITRIFKDKNIYYGLVLIWAYAGIWLKHTAENEFNSSYPNIINTVILCIALFMITLGYMSYKKIKSFKR